MNGIVKVLGLILLAFGFLFVIGCTSSAQSADNTSLEAENADEELLYYGLESADEALQFVQE